MLIWKLCFHQLKSVEETCRHVTLTPGRIRLVPQQECRLCSSGPKGGHEGGFMEDLTPELSLHSVWDFDLGEDRLPSGTVCFRWRSLVSHAGGGFCGLSESLGCCDDELLVVVPQAVEALGGSQQGVHCQVSRFRRVGPLQWQDSLERQPRRRRMVGKGRAVGGLSGPTSKG